MGGTRSVAKRQVEELAQRAAQDFDAFYAQRRPHDGIAIVRIPPIVIAQIAPS